MSASVTWLGVGRAEFRWPYDDNLLREFHIALYRRQRRWLPDRKCWLVEADDATVAEMEAWLVRHFPDAVIVDWRKAKPLPTPLPAELVEVPAAWRKLHLLPTAPRPLIELVYRFLATQPDADDDLKAAYDDVLLAWKE